MACVNLALKTSAANLLNSGVCIIYLSWLWLLRLFSIPVTLVLYSVFLTKLLTLGIILFSTAVNAVFVAKLLISGILFATTFATNLLYTVF